MFNRLFTRCPPRHRPRRRTTTSRRSAAPSSSTSGASTGRRVIRKEDVTLVPTARGLRTGVYMGWDGDRPTRCLDALVHEVDPGHDDHDPPPLLGRDPLHGRRQRLDRGRRRALRLEGVGRDPHSGVELASPRQRRRQAGPLHELFVRADALDARHEPHRGRAATSRSPACRRARSSPSGIAGRRSVRAPPAPPRAGNEEAPLGPHPHARTTSRRSSPRRAARAPSSSTTARSATRRRASRR